MLFENIGVDRDADVRRRPLVLVLAVLARLVSATAAAEWNVGGGRLETREKHLDRS